MSQTDETTDQALCHCHARSPRLDDVCSLPDGHEGPHRSDNGNAWAFPSTNRSEPTPSVCGEHNDSNTLTCARSLGHEGMHRTVGGAHWGSLRRREEEAAPPTTTACMALNGTRVCWRDQGHEGQHRTVTGERWGEHESDDPELCAATNEITPFTCIREHGHGGLHQGANDQTWSIDFRELYPPSAATPPRLSWQCAATEGNSGRRCVRPKDHEGAHGSGSGPQWSDEPETAADRCESVNIDFSRRCVSRRGHTDWHTGEGGLHWLGDGKIATDVPTDPIRHVGCMRMLAEERRQRAASDDMAGQLERRLHELKEELAQISETATGIFAQREQVRQDLLELCERVFDLERVWNNGGAHREGFVLALNNVIGLAHDHAKPVELEDDLAAEIAKHVTDDLAPGGAPRCHECGEHVPCLVMKLDQERRELKETLGEHLKRGEE